LARAMQLSCSSQYGACAVNDQHAYIGVASFGDFAEVPPGAT
jgi:hypothetical protein